MQAASHTGLRDRKCTWWSSMCEIVWMTKQKWMLQMRRKTRQGMKAKVVKSWVTILLWTKQLSGSVSAVTWLFIGLIRHLASNQSWVSFPASFYNLSFHPSFLLFLHLYDDLWPGLVRKEKEEVNLCTECTHKRTHTLACNFSVLQPLLWFPMERRSANLDPNN